MSYIFAMPLWLSFLTLHILSCLTFLLILFNFSYKKISPVIYEIDEKIEALRNKQRRMCSRDLRKNNII
jgi:hypothetical protein